MRPDLTKEYHLDGLTLQITHRYDAASGRYFEEFPDFEEMPMYTNRGKPMVCAAQDACAQLEAEIGRRCLDCGSCGFFQPLEPEALIGICTHPARRRFPPEAKQRE